MARRTGGGRRLSGVRPERFGTLAVQVGYATVMAALLLAVVTFGVLVARAPSFAAGVDAAVAAGTGPLSGSGVAWLFRAGVLGLLIGSWVLGLGLIVDGLLD
ncbi:hypothetical protein [Halomicrobium salinisoli]|uniref:hypothetical protein n=1 Tax=Halomicrobium salinisoli TaxID=2878391 RepID=UPI001CEFF262|nr:hypothetical protein [Halomicrobium salinisoli]